MKKKYSASTKDKKDWVNFTKEMGNIAPKESDLFKQDIKSTKIRKLDLHGSSLNEANKIVKKFILESFDEGCKKILIVTGKGLRSKAYDNPYVSDKLSVMKYSVPEFIKNDENLNSKISKISEAPIKDGGKGAISVFLKNNEKFTR